MLNTDVVIQILLLSDSLTDLRSAIISSRVFLDAYQQRRHTVIGTVLCREIPFESRFHGYRSALIHTDNIVKKLRRNVINDAILLYEGIRPLVAFSTLPGKTQHARKVYFEWTIRLAHLYNKARPSESHKTMPLLEEAYAALLTMEPNFDPLATVLTAPLDPCTLLLKMEIRVCRELIEEYTASKRLHKTLDVQKSVLQRLDVCDTKSAYDWGNAIMKTYRTLGEFGGAISYAMSLYNITRLVEHWRDSLIWARHLVATHVDSGRLEEAARQQECFLAHIHPGTQRYYAWARYLVVLQRRAGQAKNALLGQGAVWQQMDVTNTCYFGWSRQLADEYRKVYRNSEALTVIEWMYREAKRQLTRFPKDEAWRFHTLQSARTLAAEYEYNNRSQDAQSLLQQTIGG